MKSDTPKVLHRICGRPMLDFVLGLVKDLKAGPSVIVLGHKHEEIRKNIAPSIKVVLQRSLKGTADAVKVALPLLKRFAGTVLILYADNPLLKKETIKKLLKYHMENNLDATLLTAQLEDPSGYGRIMRDKYSGVCGIVEDKDADDFQKQIKEINTGIMCFNKNKLAGALRRVKPNNRKKEYYLTDIINIIYKEGCIIDNVKIADINEAVGVNSRSDLAKANSIIQKRINDDLMEKGVTIIDPKTTFIDYGVKIASDTTIYPFTVIERGVKIGKHCSVGPFIHLREGTSVGENVVLGNFLETVRSKINSKTLVKHFCYLGDARIGKEANIGAGTVTANFNGKQKNITRIDKGAFIGSDTVLVAPVKIGKFAKTGAGSVVTKNKHVLDGTTVAGVPAKPLKK